MAVTPAEMETWCRNVIEGDAAGGSLSVQDYLAAIPRLDSLSDLPSGTPVLVRGDVDAKPGGTIGEGDIRLRSMVETLKYGREKGWKLVIFGHIGRKPEGTLEKVAARLGELLACEVPLIKDWYDEATGSVNSSASQAISDAAPGSVLVLENTRKYDIERVLWKAKADDAPGLSERLAKFANECADKIANVYVNEALSAGSLDSSSVVVPAAMQRVALGNYLTSEFEGPMMQCLKAKLVVFSGLKTDKLDDMEAMIERGAIRMVISAGSLAMALKKAAAQLDGGDFLLGVAEDPAHSDKPYFIPAERIEQAKRMIASGREKGIEFVLPVDFVLADGSVAEEIGTAGQQFDVGPASSEYFAKCVGEFIAQHAADSEPAVAFHNGVFGMFEDSRFEEGTRRFVSELKRMKDGGVEVYVGGGEGGKALDKYGQPDWVTHCFTAGGTILNALGSEPVPYMVSLRMAATK